MKAQNKKVTVREEMSTWTDEQLQREVDDRNSTDVKSRRNWSRVKLEMTTTALMLLQERNENK